MEKEVLGVLTVGHRLGVDKDIEAHGLKRGREKRGTGAGIANRDFGANAAYLVYQVYASQVFFMILRGGSQAERSAASMTSALCARSSSVALGSP